jgi:ribosome-associated toxin RatA of RatAB toxin-antitoxin module
MALKIIFIIVIIASLSLGAFSLDFSDSSGKIVSRSKNYVIRLIETPQSNLKTAEAIFIKGSPAACLKVISDLDHYPEFMPNVRFAQFVGTKDSCTMYRFAFRVAWKTIRYCNKFKTQTLKDGGYSINWGYVNGDLKENSGLWEINPYSQQAGYSIIHYKIFIDPGMFVPGWARDFLMAKSIPKMIKAISEQVQKIEFGAMPSQESSAR